ncbi:hypothetical protein FACS189487_02720 [Campylobacterota bacterium]|nr:hypothetical protein FACS189487_02720 [Campylobacterota bacterium]
MIAIGRLQAATIIVDPLWGVAYCSAVFLGLKNNWYTAHPNNERNKIEPKTPKLGIKIMGVV